jgi:hypothetical protein
VTILNSVNFVQKYKEELIEYYKLMLEGEEDGVAEQEFFNRQDLEDIAKITWDDFKDEERGLIALFCNSLL